MQNAELQAMINSGTRIPPGEYFVDASIGLTVHSGVRLNLKGVTLKVIPNGNPKYSVLRIVGVSDVVVDGGDIIGDKHQHTGMSGEWGMGVVVSDSRRVVLDGLSVSQCWGDGIYLSANSEDVLLNRCVLSGNRRQGLTIVDCRGVTVVYSSFTSNGGTSPSCGIDIEPNDSCEVSKVVISQCAFLNNVGPAISASVPFKNLSTSHCENIKIDSCHFKDNGKGVALNYAVNVQLTNNEFTGTRGIAIDAMLSDLVMIHRNTVVRSGSVNVKDIQYAVRIKNSHNVDVTKNVLSGNYGVGLMAQATPMLTVSKNTISNTKLGGHKSDSALMVLGGCSGTVASNLISNNFGYGTYIQKGPVSYLANTVKNNSKGNREFK